MGRGSSKSGSGGGGKVVNTLSLPGGETIDLSDSPLVYGGKDPAVSGTMRKVVEDFENKRYTAKIEYNRLIDKDGNVVEENKGGKGSVGATTQARMAADLVTHNHPRDEGTLGGPPSKGDLSNMVQFGQTTYRATAKEGTYSITRGKGFQGDAMVQAYGKQQNASYKVAEKAASDLGVQYRSGKMTRNDYLKGLDKINNKMLVDDHNWLIANQKTYGYTYTLEGR